MAGSHGSGLRWTPLGILSRISRLEWVTAAVVAVVFVGLTVADPDIARAPFASARAVALVAGGTLLAAFALVMMLRFGVPPLVRVVVLVVPLALTSWWLVKPFFDDNVVQERFGTSIAAAREDTAARAADPPTTAPSSGVTPSGPQLLGSGTFIGLAGHHGRGDAGIFRLESGTVALRLENFNIDNGPDLELYLVPGADRRSPTDRSHHFGALRGNVGNQTYDVPLSFTVTPGSWTVLVWCKAFTVEFVAATVTVA